MTSFELVDKGFVPCAQINDHRLAPTRGTGLALKLLTKSMIEIFLYNVTLTTNNPSISPSVSVRRGDTTELQRREHKGGHLIRTGSICHKQKHNAYTQGTRQFNRRASSNSKTSSGPSPVSVECNRGTLNCNVDKAIVIIDPMTRMPTFCLGQCDTTA